MDVIPDTVGGADRTFLERLIARLDADHRVAALFLGGSHATGTADEYSDLDLTLITTDEGWESVHAERRELLSSLGEAIFSRSTRISGSCSSFLSIQTAPGVRSPWLRPVISMR